MTLDDATPAVPGHDFRRIAFIQAQEAGGHPGAIAVRAVAPGGTLVGVVFERSFTLELTPQSVVLKDAVTGEVTYLSHSSGPPGAVRQVTAAVATTRWVVWKETTSTNLETDDWTLFSYDRRTHRTRRIASAPRTRSGVVPAAPGYTLPSLGSNGRVYLTVIRQVGPNRYQNYVESVPADGSGPLRREAVGIAPMASGDDLVWAGDASDDLVFWHRDLASGRDTKLFDSAGTSCDSLNGLGVARDVVAWLLQCKGRDLVQVWRNGRLQATIQHPRHDLGYFEMTSRYVGFSTGSGPYKQFVYDVDKGSLLKIGKGPRDLGGVMRGHGPFLTWISYSANPRALGDTHVVRLLD